ncbi:ion transporter [Nocardioides sp. ChNu-153]|uniref:ion transporter n=1 Tax=Nocardioides sp. ChNu-153 TaxID=2779364 RepID=UPI00264C291A|nr:ion transporter [Nocardioides sp. ChNu-153]MDN7120756.1 ion transporter [Nocardioides sp. ChNu-153]
MSTPTPDLSAYPTKPPGRPLEWIMLALAIVSVVLLSWVTFFDVADDVEHWVIRADYAICAIFAVEFVVRWRRDRGDWKYPFRYWYEVIGMIPLSDPAFRAFRLLRILVILMRLGRAADRAFGDRITAAIIDRSMDTIVRAIKRPVTVAVVDEVIAVLKTGHYTANIARALGEHEAEVKSMVLEKVKQDPVTSRLRYVPFHDDIVELVADTTFRIVFQVLADPRTDQMVTDVLEENTDQIRAAVAGRAHERVAEGIDDRLDDRLDGRA